MNDGKPLVFKSLSRDVLGPCSSGGEKGVMLSTALGGPHPAPLWFRGHSKPLYQLERVESDDSWVRRLSL